MKVPERADIAAAIETVESQRLSHRTPVLSLPSVELALQRIAAPVRQGGHDVSRTDVVRRFTRSEKNFQLLYRVLADKWYLYDNSEPVPRLQEEGP